MLERYNKNFKSSKILHFASILTEKLQKKVNGLRITFQKLANYSSLPFVGILEEARNNVECYAEIRFTSCLTCGTHDEALSST